MQGLGQHGFGGHGLGQHGFGAHGFGQGSQHGSLSQQQPVNTKAVTNKADNVVSFFNIGSPNVFCCC